MYTVNPGTVYCESNLVSITNIDIYFFSSPRTGFFFFFFFFFFLLHPFRINSWSRRSFWGYNLRPSNDFTSTGCSFVPYDHLSCQRLSIEGGIKCLLTTPHHLLLDSVPNIGPLISCWELDKFKNCSYKSFRTFKIPTLLYQQFSSMLISQRDMSGPRLGALSNNRRSG